MSENLKSLRDNIDNIDREILQLLENRQKIVQKVGKLKTSKSETCFIKPDREDQMLKNLWRQQNNLSQKLIFRIWRAIISASLVVEKNFSILSYSKTHNNLTKIKLYFTGQINIKLYSDLQQLQQNFKDKPDSVIAIQEQEQDALFTILKDPENKIFAALKEGDSSTTYLIAKIHQNDLAEGENFYLTGAANLDNIAAQLQKNSFTIIKQNEQNIFFKNSLNSFLETQNKLNLNKGEITFVGSSGETSSW